MQRAGAALMAQPQLGRDVFAHGAPEGLATIVGALFGGVIQSTPYIGHPAYKAMGARSAYTLATALFVMPLAAAIALRVVVWVTVIGAE